VTETFPATIGGKPYDVPKHLRVEAVSPILEQLAGLFNAQGDITNAMKSNSQILHIALNDICSRVGADMQAITADELLVIYDGIAWGDIGSFFQRLAKLVENLGLSSGATSSTEKKEDSISGTSLTGSPSATDGSTAQ
jgi:hypothetical protein